MKGLGLCILLGAAPLAAGVPSKITYQGRLSQSGLAASGTHSFTACFRAGGALIACASPKSLSLPPSGDFTLVVDVPANVDFLNNPIQLEINVDGNTLSPADDFASVPYALVASSAATAVTAQSLAGNVNASQVQLNGTGALLNSWQSSVTPTMIDAAKVLGLPSAFWTAGAGSAVAYSGGNVGIGTAAPSYRLNVVHNDGSVGWVALFRSSHPVNDGAVLLGSRADNAGAVQSIDGGGVPQNLLVNPDGGNVGVGTSAPAAKLEVNGDFIRTIPRVHGLGPEDGTSGGRIVSRTLTVTKKRADTGLRVTYGDNLRLLDTGDSACRWEIKFNGNACPNPGPLIYDFYNSESNTHAARTLVGTCFGLPAGPHDVQIWSEAVPDHPLGSCVTGWHSQYWSIETEEVR